MESTPDRDAASLGEPSAEIDIPAVPVPRDHELWIDVPFALLDGSRHSIGWQKRRKTGSPGFVTLRRSPLGVYKAVTRYPMTDEGWAEAWREFNALDSATAERVRERLVQRGEAAAAAPAEPVVKPEVPAVKKESLSVRLANTFTDLGVRIRNGEVYPSPTFGKPALGPVKGARAEITDPTKAQMVRAGLMSGLALGAVIGPFALAPGLLRKSKAVAFVVCTNGNVHEHKLDGTAAIRAAQRDAVKFNAIAGPEEAPVSAQQPPAPLAPADRLAEVTRLHERGLLTDDEYQAKRAEIISQL